jgi:hypothetical protein
MKKKKIEDIFSSIENFSSVPPPELWAKIEEELDKPKKKKVAAIWWSLAASLLIGLAITSGLYFNSNENDILLKDNNVVLDSQENNSKSNSATPPAINTTPLNNKITVAESDNSVTNKTSNNNQESTKTVTPSINKKDKHSLKLNNETISIAESSSKSNDKTSSAKANASEVNNNFNKAKNEGIALNNNTQSSSSKNDTNISSAKEDNTETYSNSNKVKNEGIALNNITQSSSKNEANISSVKENNTKAYNNSNKDKNTGIALNSGTQSSSSKNDTNISSAKENNTEVSSNLGKDKSREIALNNSSERNLVSYNDSLNKAQIALELQQLENRLNNKEDNEEVKTEKEIITEKWSVGLYAGLVNSQNYGNKKTLGNDVESKQNTGYGVKTNYKLNKKWAVSSGLKINELGQSVANVSYYNKQQNVLSAGITNDFFLSNPSVEYISTNRNYVFSSDNSNQKIQSSEASNQTGNLDQQLQYLEMPLEVSYSVLNTGKADIRLNTGGFIGKLISNEVFLDGNSIGGNLDVNNFVYGSKFSSTLQYEVFKKTHFFVEPGVNYYINPLKTQSFNQFQWGLNFGVNFGF